MNGIGWAMEQLEEGREVRRAAWPQGMHLSMRGDMTPIIWRYRPEFTSNSVYLANDHDLRGKDWVLHVR